MIKQGTVYNGKDGNYLPEIEEFDKDVNTILEPLILRHKDKVAIESMIYIISSNVERIMLREMFYEKRDRQRNS